MSAIFPLPEITSDNSEVDQIRVAFVCLGNIAVFRQACKDRSYAKKFYIDSFGTGAYHLGQIADRRSRQECAKHGIELKHKAQKFQKQHFKEFDYIFGMDDMNVEDLQDMAPSSERAKVHLFGEFNSDKAFSDVIDDPYYGGVDGFKNSFKQVKHFSENFLDELEANTGNFLV